MSFSEFVWLRPGWLWLLPVLIIAVPYLWKQSRQSKGWHMVIAPHLAKSLLNSPHSTSRKGLFLSLLAGVLITLALAGPAVDRIEIPVMESKSGHVIVLDNSMQTRARDVSPDRHTQLKFKAHDFIDLLGEGQTGLVIYAGNAFTVTPLTSDRNQLKHMLEPVTPELMTVSGNDPLLAMEEADQLLKQAGYTQGHIFWFTAGITEQDMTELRQFFRSNNHQVSILASGSREGAPVQTADGDLLKDARGQVVITRLYPEYLQRIARETNGRFVRYSTGQDDIQVLVDTLQFEDTGQRISEDFNADEWRDLGPYLALLLIPFVVFAARKRVLLSIVPLILLLPPSAHATQVEESQQSVNPEPLLSKAFLNREQRAQRLYNEGNFDQAASVTENQMRKGQALYRSGHYQQAADIFSQLDTAEAHYNRGNSLARAGQIDDAIEAYERALSQRPDWDQASENKALLEQLKNEQSQEQQQDQGENGESSDDSQEQTPPEGADHPEGESEHNQQGRDEQPAEPSDSDDAESDTTDAQESTETEDTDTENNEMQTEQDTDEREQANMDQHRGDDLSDEEREEIEQLMRRLETDPAVLLRNRMMMESQRRRTQGPPPRGGR